MRHANEDVTNGDTQVELTEMRAALGRIPSPDQPQPMEQRGLATGTDNQLVGSVSATCETLDHQLDQEAVIQQPSVSVIGTELGDAETSGQKKLDCYSSLTCSDLQADLMGVGTQVIAEQELRPSTQVD